MNIECFYIHLARRHERLKHCVEQFSRLGIRAKQIDANDALTYHLNDADMTLFANACFVNGSFSKQIMCNALSHIKVIQHIVNSKTQLAIVCEDDVVLCDDFCNRVNNIIREWPQDAELVWIGRKTNSRYSFEDGTSNIVGKLTYASNVSSLAYIITFNGARKILDHITTSMNITCSFDAFMHRYLYTKGINYASRACLASEESAFESDVFSRS